MSDGPRPLAWAPAFFAGVAAATAAEISVGLLLYSGPGLVRSLTTILAVEAAAVSLGLWTAPTPSRPDLPEAVRRRWLLCLTVYVVATLYSAFWSVLEPVGGQAMGQGLGLAFMGGLPLYACGTLLGGMNSVSAVHGQEGAPSVGGAAFAGAMVGFAVTGIALPRVLAPASLFLGCLVLLSGGGLMWGGALDRRIRTQLKAAWPTAWGRVRVEDRRLVSHETAARVVFEGDHVRGWMVGGQASHVPWDVSILRSWAAEAGDDVRVLLVGGGASSLPDAAIRGFPSVAVHVFERNPAVLEAAREHLEVGLSRESERLQVLAGNLEDHLQEAAGWYDIVIVDLQGLGAVGGIESLSRAGYAALFGCTRPGGAICLGPEVPTRSLPEGWTRTVLSRPVVTSVGDLELDWPKDEQVLVASPSGDLPWLMTMEGFVLQGEAPPTVPALPPTSS